MVRTTAANSYPKISSDRGEVNIRNALNRHEKGNIDNDSLEKAFRETIRRTLREQNEAGLDLVTDGLIRWDDPVSRFCEGVKNLNRGGLLRFFKNNVYYRRPVIDGDLSVESTISLGDYLFAAENSDQPVKAVLPGPVTFHEMTEDRHYGDDHRLYSDIETILTCEATALSGAGCRHIQFDEPSVPARPDHISRSIDIINRISATCSADIWVYIYFGDLDSIAESIGKYEVSVFGCDCASYPQNRDVMLESGGEFDLCFGIIDARDLRVESEDHIKKQLDEIACCLHDRDFWVSPSCSLEFLPHEYALKKLTALTGAVNSIREAH